MVNYSPVIHPWNQELWRSLTDEPERANHALLFTGNRGLGKQALALALTHFVMCENHSQSESLFNAGFHPDLHVLMPEILSLEAIEKGDLFGTFAQRYIEPHGGKPKKVINIDQVRKLGLALNTHPHISKTRVIVIVCTESMNNSAANALLKNLEEPPANTLFILVTDEISRLAKTIRSRCSLINFRAPDTNSAKAWLTQQGVIVENNIDTHLAMANNHPLLALELYKDNYIESLKSVFTDVNGLWSNKTNAILAAKNWQKIGGLQCVDILQKMVTDLLRSRLSKSPKTVFFPVQQSWIKSVSVKLSKQGLVDISDDLNYAKRMLSTSVDELLVLETLSSRFSQLPI